MRAITRMRRAAIVFVLLISSGIAAQPVVSDETPLGPPPSPVAAPDVQWAATVIAGGDGFLAAWADNRGGFGSPPFGARITAAGEVLDPLSIPIAGGAMTWTGRDYLMVAQTPRGVGVSRLPARGGEPGNLSIIIGEPRLVADVAANGDGFLVLTTDIAADYQSVRGLYATLLDAEARVVKTFPLMRTAFRFPRIFVRDGRYLAVVDVSVCLELECPYQVTLITIDNSSELERKPVVRLAGYPSELHHVDTASNGRELLLLFVEGTSFSAQSVDIASGTASRRKEIVRAKEARDYRLLRERDGFVLYWLDHGALFRKRIGAPGPAAKVAYGVSGFEAASDGSTTALVWSGSENIDHALRHDHLDVFARVLRPDQETKPFLLSMSMPLQDGIALAGTFAALRESRSATARVAAGIPPLQARALETDWIGALPPDVAASAKEYVAVWAEVVSGQESQLVAQRHDRSGSPAGERVVLDRCAGGVSIASNGEGYLVASARCDGVFGLRLLRLDAALQTLATNTVALEPVRIATLVPPPEPPRLWSHRVVWTGTEFLIAWLETGTNATLRIVRYDGAGTKPVQTIGDGRVPPGTSLDFASHRGKSAVAWLDHRTKTKELCVAAQLVGEEKPRTLHCMPSGEFVFPEVAITPLGDDFLVAWSERRGDQYDILAMRLGDTKPFVIAASRFSETSPVLSNDGDEVIVAYKRVTAEAGNVTRAYTRRLRFQTMLSRQKTGSQARVSFANFATSFFAPKRSK